MDFRINTDLSHFEPASLWGLVFLAAFLSFVAYNSLGRSYSARALLSQFVLVTIVILIFCAFAFQDSSGIYLSGLIQGAVYAATFIVVALLTLVWKQRKTSR